MELVPFNPDNLESRFHPTRREKISRWDKSPGQFTGGTTRNRNPAICPTFSGSAMTACTAIAGALQSGSPPTFQKTSCPTSRIQLVGNALPIEKAHNSKRKKHRNEKQIRSK